MPILLSAIASHHAADERARAEPRNYALYYEAMTSPDSEKCEHGAVAPGAPAPTQKRLDEIAGKHLGRAEARQGERGAWTRS